MFKYIIIQKFGDIFAVTKPTNAQPTNHSAAPPQRPANPPPRPTPPPRPVTPELVAAPNVVAADILPDVAQNQEVDLLNLSNNGVPHAHAVGMPKEPSFDLLGSFEMAEAQGNNAMPDLLSNSQTKLPGLDDIFGAFSSAAQTNASAAAAPDLDFINHAPAPQPAAVPPPPHHPFDLAADLGHAVNNVPLMPTSKETSPQQPTAASTNNTNNNNSNNKDPFADIGNLASGLNLNWANTQPMRPSPMNSAHSTQASSPIHQFGAFMGASSSSANLSAATSPRAPSTPTHPQATTNQARPDYSRSNFDPPKAAATNIAGAAGAGGGGDIFADILGQQGYNFASKASQGPRSINEMRKEELVKDMDPDKLKILEWVSMQHVDETLYPM